MDEPCVKGTLFANVASELNALVADGALSSAGLAKALSPDEVRLVESDVAISTWYSLSTYSAMLRLLANAHTRDGSDYLLDSGRESARRVIELGLYAQLDERTFLLPIWALA